MRKLGRRIVITSATILAAMIAYGTAQQAGADTFSAGPPNGGREPDNMNHWGCWELGGSTIPMALFDKFWVDVPNDTNVAVFWDSTCNATTDVLYRNDLVDNTAPFTLGDYLCLSNNGQGECEQSRVRLNDGYYVNTSADYYCHSYHCWCHEIGHSLGLTHNETAANCLRSGDFDGCAVPNGDFTTHHVSHVNSDIN